MTIFGSSNWTGPSGNFQLEHNYFTTKVWFFNWFVNQFERKWNSATENEPFVPLPPTQPSYVAPANSAIAQPTTLKLQWEGGPWAHKYDIYFGTTPNPPLLVADVSTFQSGAQAGQPLLDTGSVDDGVMETYTIPAPLQAGTTYYWKIVGKTMANVTATGPVWSFTTAGSGAGAGGSDRIDRGSCFVNADQSDLERCWQVTTAIEWREVRRLEWSWAEIANLPANHNQLSQYAV